MGLFVVGEIVVITSAEAIVGSGFESLVRKRLKKQRVANDKSIDEMFRKFGAQLEREVGWARDPALSFY